MNSTVFYSTPEDELLNKFRSIVSAEMQTLFAKQPQPKEPDQYLTRIETAQLFRITLPTLNEYTKQGRVKSYRIGARILYKREEVFQAIKSIGKYERV